MSKNSMENSIKSKNHPDKCVLNPYLPLWEYIPDAEPRIFGDRLYVYGSHDFAGGDKGYCPGDYVVWSAPLSDLSDFRLDGTAFKREDCPDIKEQDAMAAPDVVKGVDGRYYLYWNNNMQMVCRIAVSDKPEGPFTYYGEVSLSDGTAYSEYKMFDPGVLVDDDGRVYLYVGFCMTGPVPERYKGMKSPFAEYSLGFELASDMKTIVSGPVEILPGGNRTDGTGFEGHGFYEASSPRKINGKYVMVYSSERSHEMAYALADEPLGKYEYKGALVSSADIGLNGNEEPVMPHGNVHGGLVQLEGRWYIFYHRQTHGIECCRQSCAEPLVVGEDGWFLQAEITSCGLNKGPLPAQGSYNACYACHLTSPSINPNNMTVRECRRDTEPHIFEENSELHYISRLDNGSVVGFKYFEFGKDGVSTIKVQLKGSTDKSPVKLAVRLDSPEGREIGKLLTETGNEWEDFDVSIENVDGIHALYFVFEEADDLKFQSISFS